MKITTLVLDLFHGDAVKNLSAARQFGIHGVIHKASEGEDYTDPTYARRRKDAGAAGLLWGAYHFLRPGDPAAQAQHFIAVAAPDATTLLAADHEDKGVTLADAIAFMRAAEAIAGRKVLLYSGSLIKAQIKKATKDQLAYLGSRRLWLCHYSARPTWPGLWKAPWLWQFTGDGAGPSPHHVPGISGNVDINSYAGTAGELSAEWAGEAITA